MIPPLKLTDTAAYAIAWLEEFRTKELPVVNNGEFLGLINDEQILDSNDGSKLIGDFDLGCADCYVQESQYFYDILKLAVDSNVELVGVVDESKEFVGVITIQDTITAFAQTTPIQAEGSVLVLSMDSADYSLSELSRLVEENNARILSSSVRQDPGDVSRIKVTLKINLEDISSIVATFERFEYKIISRFQETVVTEDDRDKIDELLKYLDL
ncbi:MAG: cbs domain containing protein [Bacteroidetes bacterium]|nr:MAG: cbs domain containing protein [Bacteroidota bacterium]